MKITIKKIKNRTKRKTSPELVKTIEIAKKEDNKELLKYLSRPTREQIKLNLDEINKKIKDQKEIIVPGKVLGVGELSKKIIIYSLAYSKAAEEKIKKQGSEIRYLSELLDKNKTKKIELIA